MLLVQMQNPSTQLRWVGHPEKLGTLTNLGSQPICWTGLWSLGQRGAWDDGGGYSGFALVVGALYFANVGLCFGEGRDAAIFLHAIGASVVGGESEDEVVVVAVEKLTEVAGAGVDIFAGIENVAHAEARGGAGDELHQAAGIF